MTPTRWCSRTRCTGSRWSATRREALGHARGGPECRAIASAWTRTRAALLLCAAAVVAPPPPKPTPKPPTAALYERGLVAMVRRLKSCADSKDNYETCLLLDPRQDHEFTMSPRDAMFPIQAHRVRRAAIRADRPGDPTLVLSEGLDIVPCTPGWGNLCQRFKKFAGTAMVLAHPWGGNYQHFVFEALPKAVVFSDALRRVRPDAQVVTAGLAKPWQVDWLAAAGVNATVAGNYTGVGFEEVFMFSPLASNFGFWSPMALGALGKVHSRVAIEGVAGDRRTYFPRGGGQHRVMTNEPELTARLESLGFASRDFTSFPTVADRARYFCGADLPSTNRGDAAAATWILRGEKSRASGICRSIRWS